MSELRFQAVQVACSSNLCTLNWDVTTNGGDVVFQNFHVSQFPCTINTNGGDINYVNSILTAYSANESLNANGGNITFDSTSQFIVNNNFSVKSSNGTISMPNVSTASGYPSALTVNAGSGSVTLNTTASLTSIAITAGNVYSTGMSTKGSAGISMSSGSTFCCESLFG